MEICFSRRDVAAGVGIAIASVSAGSTFAHQISRQEEGNRTMTESEVLDLFTRYIAALNAHEMDRMDEFVHVQVLQNLTLVPRTKVIADLKGHIEAVPDFKWRAKDVIVKGDTVAGRFLNIGTPARRWLDVEPTGRTIETLEFCFHKARDGKFYEMNYAMDVMGLRHQLGL